MKITSKIKGENKSIKTQFTLIIVCLVVISCLLLGGITGFLNYKTTNEILSNTVVETTREASQHISSEIRSIQMAAMQTGTLKKMSDPKISIDEKKSLISAQAKLYGFERGNLLDINGNSYFDGNNYSDRDYFKVSISGKEYISDPTKSKVTGKTTFLVSAPVWKDGIQGGEVAGVIYFVPNENFLNDIVSDIKIGPNSYAYLINNKGTTIADEEHELVGVENSIEQSKTDSSLLPYAKADKKLVAGESGYNDFRAEGKSWILGYTPVKHTNGWGIGVMVQKNDFLGGLYSSIITTVIVAIVFIAISIVVAIRFSNKTGNPLKACSERLKRLADGDLNSEVPIENGSYEIRLLSDATNKIVTDFREMIKTLIHVLTEISDGNLDIDLSCDKLNSLFVNDFEPMMSSINKIVYSLNSTLNQINIASEQVANGSEQVSEGAQVLSQGATEQASSIEELSSTIGEVSLQIKETAQNSVKAKQIATEANNTTVRGQNQMQQMVIAMDEIANTSNEIGSIIKNIDDIAFQTNILALNAAVEAARAGEAGKGFAVVADEVRNLAAKSAESAKTTATLIERAIVAIENGNKIVLETAKSLDEIIVDSKETAQVIQSIADATNEQAQAITQANIGLEQISVVVQTNSATSEESAAASEELSAQAQMLKDLIGKFNLKDN
jgi:methyl-accepting chemotaxis protein